MLYYILDYLKYGKTILQNGIIKVDEIMKMHEYIKH